MRGAVFAMGLLVFGGLLAACTSQEERAAEHRTAAEEYAEAEQWAEAKIEYVKVTPPSELSVGMRLPAGTLSKSRVEAGPGRAARKDASSV